MFLVMWRDLELIGIDKDTLVQVAPLSDVPLKTALKLLLNAAASRDAMLDYTVVDGVIVIATKPTLSKFGPETRVYDVTDLVQPPAEYHSRFNAQQVRRISFQISQENR